MKNKFCFVLLIFSCHYFTSQGQTLKREDVIGIWKLIDEKYEDKNADKIIRNSIKSGNYIRVLEFKADNTYVDTHTNNKITSKLIGKWEIKDNVLYTKDTRLEPPYPNSEFADSFFEDLKIKNDTLTFSAQSESIGTSYFVRIK